MCIRLDNWQIRFCREKNYPNKLFEMNHEEEMRRKIGKLGDNSKGSWFSPEGEDAQGP